MTIINYDREHMRGLLDGIEDGDEIITMMFYEYLIVEGLISIDMHRTPSSQIDGLTRTIQGQLALQAWAKQEAIEEAMAI